MGQYYYVANLDKMEVLCVDGTYNLGKLLEIAEKKDVSLAILNQMAGPWRGDHVYLVGDYASIEEVRSPYYETIRAWTDRLHLVNSLYEYIEENCSKAEGTKENLGYRFIYNHARNEYIDVAHCPKCCDGNDWRQGFIHPLPLMIAMGNGLGSGDYKSGFNEHLVGTWCDSVSSLVITKEPQDDLGFQEIHPDFIY